MSHTYAILDISPSAYAEIRAKLDAAGYQHAFHQESEGDVMDMHGLALRADTTCPDCGGSGTVPVGEHFVTRDMAIDGGDPALEGASMGVEWGRCDACGGAGRVEVAP